MKPGDGDQNAGNPPQGAQPRWWKGTFYIPGEVAPAGEVTTIAATLQDAAFFVLRGIEREQGIQSARTGQQVIFPFCKIVIEPTDPPSQIVQPGGIVSPKF